MKKTYEIPQAELVIFTSQDALTASAITGTTGVNWSDDTFWL